VLVTGIRIEEIKRVKRYSEPMPAVKASFVTLFSASYGHGNAPESLRIHECFDSQVVVNVINDSPHSCRLSMDGDDIASSPGMSVAVRLSDIATDVSAWKWVLPGTKRGGGVLLPDAIKESMGILWKQVHRREECRRVLDSVEVQVSSDGDLTIPVPTRSPLTLSISLKRSISHENAMSSAWVRLCLIVTDSYGCEPVSTIFRSGRWNLEFDLSAGSSIVHKAVVGFTLPGIYHVHCAVAVMSDTSASSSSGVEVVWRYIGCTIVRSIAVVTP